MKYVRKKYFNYYYIESLIMKTDSWIHVLLNTEIYHNAHIVYALAIY